MNKSLAKALWITNLKLENWRNFVEIDIDLPQGVFLVGPNASGKSNLLDIFRFLYDLSAVGGGFQEAVRSRGGVSSLRSLAARRYSDINIHVCVGNDVNLKAWEYKLRFNQDKLRRARIKEEVVLNSGKQILSRPEAEDKKDPERLSQTYLEQVYANQPFRNITDFFSSIRYSHIVPQLVREPDRSFGKKNDPFGGDFLEQIAQIPPRTQNARLRRIREALRVAVPQLKELELWRDERGTPHLRGKYKHWRPQGKWQTEEVFSDGTLRLLGLLWAILDRGGPLLLEEPEISLHPEVVRYIPQLFARLRRRSGRQVIVSTHSSDLLRDPGIGLDEVLLLQPGNEGTSVRSAMSIQDAKLLLEGGISLADIVIPRTRPPKAEQLSLFGE